MPEQNGPGEGFRNAIMRRVQKGQEDLYLHMILVIQCSPGDDCKFSNDSSSHCPRTVLWLEHEMAPIG